MTTPQSQLKRRGLLQAAIAAGVFGASSVPIVAAPKNGGLLRAAFSGDVFKCALRNGSIFENLTRISADGLLHGELAINWSANSDATRWTFELRRDAVFHDGCDFGASDVIAPLISGLHNNLISKISNAVDIAKTGHYSVQIHLGRGNPDLPYLLAHPQLAIRKDEHIGTGLYRVESTENRILRARRVLSHYRNGTAGWFDELEIHQIEKQTKREAALLERIVDVIDIDHQSMLLNTTPNRRAKVIWIKGKPTLAKNSRLTGDHLIGDGWACHNICIPTQWSMA